MTYYVPEWELPKIAANVRSVVNGFSAAQDGMLPAIIHIFLLEDEHDPRMEFVLMKDKAGRYYYESIHQAETNGTPKYLKIYLE